MQDKTVKKLLIERSRLVAELGILTHILHGSWIDLRQLRTEQLAFLEALGLGPPAFTDPNCCCQRGV